MPVRLSSPRVRRRKSKPKGLRMARRVPPVRAVGTVQLAAEFLVAGRGVQTSLEPPNRPATFLYCHAMELLFKAVLICAGTDDARLRTLGHDLAAVLREVRKHPTTLQPILSRSDHMIIGMLNGMYRRKDFEYLFTGARRYPSLDAVDELCGRLLRTLRPEIEARIRTTLRLAKRRP
jgi:hypothetical protein